jgi:uncharacterized protein
VNLINKNQLNNVGIKTNLGGGDRMKTKQLIFLITMALSFIGFTGNSFSFDLGGTLNSITKELEKGDLGEPPGQAKQQNNTKKLSSVEMEIEYEKSELAVQNKNWSRVIEIVKPLAEQGHAKSQARLGAMLFSGKHIKRNMNEGIKWSTLAAKQGNAKAQSNLGFAYTSDKDMGVFKNQRKAAQWFHMAADQGYVKAQYILGKYYVTGKHSFPIDDAQAFKYYGLAAKQGHAPAQYYLGQMYYHGQSVPKNIEESLKWLKLAAEQGIDNAKRDIPIFEEEKRIADENLQKNNER